MKCPKCKTEIEETETVCPKCKKVLAIECPNCHSMNTSSRCSKCGYILLTKCSKCGKTVSTKQLNCKCGFPVKKSIAYQECENDEFASIIIKFSSLKRLKKALGSQELYTKFFFRLKNLLYGQINKTEGTIINYNDIFTINLNKELSFQTSTNKAIRLAIKIINAFTELNQNIINEFSFPLNLNITIIKKFSENLLENTIFDNNIKLLEIKKDQPKYLKGMQIILDEYASDCISKDFNIDSLYTMEKDKTTLSFYELILEKYILPPNEQCHTKETNVIPKNISKDTVKESKQQDIYGFKVFDINAKCKFEKINALSVLNRIDSNMIISLKGDAELQVNLSDIVNYYTDKGLQVLHAICTEEMKYQPWGILKEIYRNYYNLSIHRDFIPESFQAGHFNHILELIKMQPRKASTSEDARFAYMEDFEDFLNYIKNCVIIIENFELIDETTIQTLELYFDKFKNIKNRFIFTTNKNTSIHTKIKELLRTPLYTEFVLEKSGMDSILSNLREEATDFIQSFYYDKIKENFNGSLLYFKHAIQYLKDKDILISFENKLIIKNNTSIVIPNNLFELIKARLKFLSKDMDASMILAYSNYLGPRLDINVLKKLGINNIEKSIQRLIDSGFAYFKNNNLYINNYNIIKPIFSDSIKDEVNIFLSKNILAQIGKNLDSTSLLLIMGKLGLFKEEYLLLWKNSQFAMLVGDYDAYLKNCLGFLSLIKYIENNIPAEDIEANKKEVYQNILLSLYSYAPEKIYDIENILLIDAMNSNDNDKIVKLSNLMLQGALITSNYADAFNLVHNILSRMQNPTLIVDGNINTKFLLLSLVNIEILFNIGEFSECVDTTNDILQILKPELIEKIKPASFSTNLFVKHLQETFRLSAFAKMLLMDNEIESFLEKIKTALGEDLEDKDCILSIIDYLANKEYTTPNIETSSAFSKVIYLILQEFDVHSKAPKNFAQNIYQAKLLAEEIHQTQLELFCDLLIAHSYAQIGIKEKAEFIYNDVIKKSEKSAIFNILTLAKYFLAQLYLEENKLQEALQLVNDTLALIQKYNNQSKIMYVLLEKLFISTIKLLDTKTIDLETEEQKIAIISSSCNISHLL